MAIKYAYIEGNSKEFGITDFLQKDDATDFLKTMNTGTVLIKYSDKSEKALLFYKYQDSSGRDSKESWIRITKSIEYYLSPELKAYLVLLNLPFPINE